MSALAKAKTVVSAEQLRRFTFDVLKGAGMDEANAAITADAIIWRELRDAVPAGLPVLPNCVATVRASGDGATRPLARQEFGALTVLDANRGWGQAVAVHGMRLAVERARTTGIGVVLVRESSTANAMGYYPTIAIEQRMVGLAVTNSWPYQAPWGGTTKVLGNQAFSYGVPAGRNHPILFDGSTTAVSASGINKARAQGGSLPEGVALDAQGLPTTDPSAALLGFLLPMGGHRGFGLTVLWEVLTGVLAGGERFGADIPHDVKQPNTSLFLLAIDPGASMPYERFVERVDRLIDQIHASPPAPGVDEVLLPGERGNRQAERHLRDGVPLTVERIEQLTALGREVGVEW